MDLILDKWDEILQTVKTEHDITDISFETWIKPLEVYGVEGNTLYILVPSVQMTLNPAFLSGSSSSKSPSIAQR